MSAIPTTTPSSRHPSPATADKANARLLKLLPAVQTHTAIQFRDLRAAVLMRPPGYEHDERENRNCCSYRHLHVSRFPAEVTLHPSARFSDFSAI